MRFVTYLACATLVARAEIVEEDDDDLQFMRGLATNNMSNATTMTPSTTTSTTTMMKTESNATTTTATPTIQGNATTNSAGESTTMPDSVFTAKPADKPAELPPRKSAPDVDMQAAKLANATAANVDTKSVTEILVTSTFTTKDTLGDELATYIVSDVEAPASGDAVQTANVTAGAGRRLGMHTAALTKAHNLFCAAFGFTASYAACKAMPKDVKVELYTSGGDATDADGLANCVSGITLGSRHPMNTKNCLPSSNVKETPENGVCFANALASGNYDEIAGTTTAKPVQLSPETKACTVSNKGTAVTVGNATAPRVFDSSVTIEIPNWLVAASDVEVSEAAFASVTAEAQTAVSSNEAAAVLQAALIVAAVEIATKVSDAQFNVTEALGIPDAQWGDIVSAVMAEGDLSAFLAKVAADPASAGAKFTAAVALVEANVIIENESAPPSTGTSDAPSLVLGLSMFISLLSLIF